MKQEQVTKITGLLKELASIRAETLKLKDEHIVALEALLQSQKLEIALLRGKIELLEVVKKEEAE